MKVKLKYFLNFKKITGHSKEELFFKNDKVNVKDVFKVLYDKYQIEYKKTMARSIIMINNRSINQLKKENTALKDGDVLIIMPMISGG
ncbi:MAG: MoaD/ThiS family protein [Candidatus Atribacteria bacterium]